MKSAPNRQGPHVPRRPFWYALASATTLALLSLAGTVPSAVGAPAAGSLPLTANTLAWAQVGPSRTTQLAEISVTAPRGALEFGLQFRAKKKSSGYRTKVKVASNGAVSGSFSRVKSNSETALSGGGPLGFSVSTGDRIHLEATVAAKKAPRLYLRAWKEGAHKPSGWQLVARDSSAKKRISKPGAVYLWARTPAGSPGTSLKYSTMTVAKFSLREASQIGTDESLERSSNSFSIAVIGDTQEETRWSTDPRFADRTKWLAEHKNSLNLKYVLHTGDIVNWGWLAPQQFTRARSAMNYLTAAGVPYSVAVGNHDTRSVGWDGLPGSTGYGGGPYSQNPECPTKLDAYECKSWRLVRHTEEFNDTFSISSLTARIKGQFEPGKIDNTWTTFTVLNTKWMILSLEFTPRRSAVEWARKVVAKHPDHNVIIITHYYLDSNGKISPSNAGYGETSGKYLYEQIVSKYPSVKIVAAGHTGRFTSRTDTSRGNRIVSYLGNMMTNSENPVRVLTINVKTGVVSNTVYSKVSESGATRASTGKAKLSIIR